MAGRKQKRKRIIYYGALCLLTAGAVWSGWSIARRLWDERQNNSRLEMLADFVRAAGETDPGGMGDGAGGTGDGIAGNSGVTGNGAGNSGVAGNTDGLGNVRGANSQAQALSLEEQLALRRERLAGYGKLKEQNPDLVGWITVPGTRIDYPVMWSPEQPDYYLRHDFDKKKSAYGLPYIGGNKGPGEGGACAVYGHHMKNGSMFAGLMGYTEPEFYEQHPWVWFDTVDEPGLYRIVGVMKESALTGDQDLIRFVTGAGTDETGDDRAGGDKAGQEAGGEKTVRDEAGGEKAREEFENFMKKLKERSFYDTGYTASYGDRLIILTTCEYSQREGRLLVAAVKMDEIQTGRGSEQAPGQSANNKRKTEE